MAKLKIFLALNNLITGKFEKKLLKSLYYILPTCRKENLDYTQNKQKIVHKNEKQLATFQLLRSKIIMKFERSGNITRQFKSVKKHRHYRQK